MSENQRSSREQYRQRIEHSVTYITENLAEPLDLARVAAASHFSPYHFHRIFANLVGETPVDFVNRLRLEKAANMLLKSTQSITEIALSCGFSSPSTFARSFKKHFGLSASAYASTAPGEPTETTSVPANRETVELPDTREVSVRLMPGYHVAYAASLRGYNLAEICRAWERLTRWAAARGLFAPDSHAIGISFDDPLITPRGKCRYYACLTVPLELKHDRLVGFMDIPGGRCVVCHVTCAAEQIESVYRFLYRDWLPDSGLQPADYPCYEIYQQTPETHPQGLYVLDVCIPALPL